ncbi:hypothetical protein ACEWY4_008465 [Coilia grayii]|uniref:Uncharacterized protein n=1 Tax=Coilia grayii TaxID=363190 RepID=A0ABD1KB26_9TELE
MSLPLKCEGGDTDPDPVTRLKHQKNPMSEAEVTAESGGGGGEEAEKGLSEDSRPQSTSPFCGSPHQSSLKPPLCSVQNDADSENTNIRVAAAVMTFDNAHRDSSSESCSSDNKQQPASFPSNARLQQARPRSPVSSVGSMQTDDSMDRDIKFREADSKMKTLQPGPCSVVSSVGSMQTDDSMDRDNNFREADTDISTDANPPLPEKTRCSVCSKTAVKSCLTCCTSYCGDHVKHHYTSPDLQKHTLVEAGDLKKRLCERHHRVLEIFCATDQTAICTLCVFDHIGHNFSPLTDNESHQQSTDLKGPVNKDLPPPGPVRFTSVTSDSVSLGWGCPDGLAGPQRFRVVWGCGADQRSLEVDGLSVDVEGLDPGKDYNFSVVTLSEDGTQSPCVSASVQTEVPQPQNLTVNTDSSSASVRWTKPKGLEQATFSISLYAGGECLKTIIKDSQECSFDLQPDTDYTVAIATVLKNGKKSKAISKAIRTNMPVPDNLKTSSVTATSATLAWRLSPGEEEAEPHSFLISYHSKGTQPLTVSSDSYSKVITGLKPHTQYTIRVSTKIQNGGESQPATLTIATDYSHLSGPLSCSLDVVNPVQRADRGRLASAEFTTLDFLSRSQTASCAQSSVFDDPSSGTRVC